MSKPFNDHVTRLIAEQSDAKFQADLAVADASAARVADAGEDLAAMSVAKEHAPLTGDVDKIAAAKAAVKAAEQELAQAEHDHAVLRGDVLDSGTKQVGKPGAVVATTGTEKPSSGTAWVDRARARAKEIFADYRSRDLHPNQINVADQIAREFRSATPPVSGPSGKPLTGTYIKRHALGGISSAQSKQLSTAIHRGK